LLLSEQGKLLCIAASGQDFPGIDISKPVVLVAPLTAIHRIDVAIRLLRGME